MTTPVLFLLGAVALSIVLGLAVWLFSRPRKQKFGSTIDSFNTDLSALAPRAAPDGARNTRTAGHTMGASNKPGPRPRS